MVRPVREVGMVRAVRMTIPVRVVGGKNSKDSKTIVVRAVRTVSMTSKRGKYGKSVKDPCYQLTNLLGF